MNEDLNEAAIVCCQRGVEHYLQGDTGSAIADFTEAIRLNTTFAQAYVMRGAAQESISAAIADFTEAIRLNPDYVQAYYNRGFLRGAQGNYLAAIDDFTQVLQRQPNHPQASNMRLDIAEWRKRLE